MKRILLTSLIFCTALLFYGQSVHFGTTAVSGDDEFKSYYSEEGSTGAYLGASNSFPVNTVVTVTNPGNGESVSVTIVKRLSHPGLFMVLSPEAGEAISFPENDVLDLQVVEKRKNDDVFTSYAEDKAFSSDPDLNPSAELTETGTPELAASPESVESETSELTDATEAADTETPEIEDVTDTAETESTEMAELTDTAETETTQTEDIAAPEPSIDEYIPPVLMDLEGSDFNEGYDPLVLLESEAGEESEPLLSEETETELPLPEEFDDNDLPATYEPDWPEDEDSDETEESALVVVPEEPDVALDAEDVDSELLDPTVDDLLIFEPVEDDSEEDDTDLADALISEPAVGEIPEDLRETIVMVPDMELEPETLDSSVISEPYVEVPEMEEEEPPVIIPFVPDSETAESSPLDDSDLSVIEPVEKVEAPSEEESSLVVIEAASLDEMAEGAESLDSDLVIPEEEIETEAVVIEEDNEAEVVIIEDVVETTEKKPEKKEEKDKAPQIVEDVIVAVPPEEETMTSPSEDPPENVIYFLTPGDFRPPPKSEEKKEEAEETVPEEKTVEPMLVERSELEYLIVRELHNGGSYLQLGTYSSVDVLYAAIKNINDAYPTIVLTMGEGDDQLYKLLIGPITRDEKGIVITRFRSLGYGDAFLYSPH